MIPKWLASYYGAKSRCKKGGSYYKKGIKLLMTKENFEYLWRRDCGWLLKSPSINRRNPDGHYEIDNCEFIERYDNITQCRRFGKHHTKEGRKNIGDSLRGMKMNSKYRKLLGMTIMEYCKKYGVCKKRFYRIFDHLKSEGKP